jgi:Restriction endonuclease/TIR domain
MKKSVFISYAQKDADKIAKLSEELASSGVALYCPMSAEVGTDFQASMVSELRKSSLFIAFLSEGNSQHVMFELGYAMGAAKQVLVVGGPEARIPSGAASLELFRFDENDPSSLWSLVDTIRRKIELVKEAEPDVRDPKSKLEMMLSNRDYLEEFSPKDFEEVVADYFKALDFGVELTSSHTDKGYDFALTGESQESIIAVVQVKKYQADGILSLSHVRQFVGCLTLEGLSKGILVTNARFSPASHEVARKSPKSLLLLTIEDLIAADKAGLMLKLMSSN